MDAGHVRVASVTHGPACVIRVSGELTLDTGPEFAARAAEAVAASRGPVLFDVSAVDFMDLRGARALVRAIRAVPPPRETGLDGCGPTMLTVLAAIGFDPPRRPGSGGQPSLTSRPGAPAGPSSRAEAMMAMARAAQSEARQSARYASGVMARLAATYCELALNSRYRMDDKSDERGRLLVLSGRALDLSRRYLRAGAAESG